MSIKLRISAAVAMLMCNPSIGLAQTPKENKPPPLSQAETNAALDYRLQILEARVEASFANLDCNTHNFDSFIMQSPKMLMFASCKNIEPYLEGHRLTIQIGNPYTFSF